MACDFYKKCSQIIKSHYPSAGKYLTSLKSSDTDLKATAKNHPPRTKESVMQKTPAPNPAPRLPLSPLTLKLKPHTKEALKKTIHLLYKMTHLKEYLQHISPSQEFKNWLLKLNLQNTTSGKWPSSALLMCYDFHTDEQGIPHLIEVNTNASGYLMAVLACQAQGQDFQSPLKILRQSFQREWQSFSGKTTPPPLNLIVDENIQEQKMYLEFLMYKDLLNSWGWPTRLQEASTLTANPHQELQTPDHKKAHFIYNRLTDFYFEKHPPLKKAFLKKTCLLSPHPVEYLLLADKARLCDWSSPQFLNHLPLTEEEKQWITNTVLFTGLIKNKDPHQLWNQRKQFVFKPLRGYGGKSVYRGKSLTKKTFQRLLKEEGVYQKIMPPPVFKAPDGSPWKYDIRVYAYKDQVQHITARLYQGQLTNFQNPHSGFAAIV